MLLIRFRRKAAIHLVQCTGARKNFRLPINHLRPQHQFRLQQLRRRSDFKDIYYNRVLCRECFD